MRLFLDQYLFKTVIDIARTLVVVVIDLLIVTLCIQYFYAALGFELFGSTHVNKSGFLPGLSLFQQLLYGVHCHVSVVDVMSRGRYYWVACR